MSPAMRTGGKDGDGDEGRGLTAVTFPANVVPLPVVSRVADLTVLRDEKTEYKGKGDKSVSHRSIRKQSTRDTTRLTKLHPRHR